jgi:RNA-directed DNA polymerase
VENQTLFPTEAGTPQGGIISPTLANLTLDGLEHLLKEKFSAKQTPSSKVNLVRYADDCAPRARDELMSSTRA